MRLGCFGCFGTILMLAVVTVTLLGAGWALGQMLETPDLPTVTPEEGRSAQQKLYEITRRGGRGDRRDAPVVLSEGEINGFLAQHLAGPVAESLSGVRVRLLGRSTAEILVPVNARDLVVKSGYPWLADRAPITWLERRLWLRFHGPVRLDRGESGRSRMLRLEVDQFFVGRQRLPASVFRLVSDGTERWLQWRVPEWVDGVSIEPGRALVTTSASPGRSGSEGRR